jgi:thiamine-monophosphate kinase
MGARPLHYLLTTALPAAVGTSWVSDFARGLEEDQRQFGIDLLGGDSVATPGPASFSLTAIGEVAAGGEIRRSGAQLGDLVWVSGTIGDAFLGLRVLRGAHPELAAEHRAALISRFQIPDPRVQLGPQLAGIARAMIDVSDGLLADLDHICEASHVAAVVELERLPLSPAVRLVVAAEPDIRFRLVAGGDDYELLFTSSPDATDTIGGLGAQLGVPITMIGRIEAGLGARLVDGAGQTIAVEAAGYRHF